MFIVCLKKGNRISNVFLVIRKCLGFFTGSEIRFLPQAVHVSLIQVQLWPRLVSTENGFCLDHFLVSRIK